MVSVFTNNGVDSFQTHSNLSGCHTEQQLRDWLTLIRDQRWSLTQKHQLLNSLSDPCEIYQCSVESLRKQVSGRIASTHSGVTTQDIERDMRWLLEAGQRLITFNDTDYPPLLKEIYDPPIALFAKGDLECLADPKVAIVGSRRPTPVGSTVTTQLANHLGLLGVVVTSGMALGIDGVAHLGALQAGAPTIAVMACGMDTIYPARHRPMFEQIAASGCVLSEYPIGYPPSKFRFPQRNRIVSGLSLGVVIVEAAERSGTLITARLAMEHNRQLMVVPGSALSSQYKGSHRLMQQGAAVVTGVDDILNLLAIPLNSELQKSPICATSKNGKSTTNPVENHVLKQLSDRPCCIDDIILASGLTSAEVSAMLLTLEVEGVVAATDDGGYVRLN